MRRELKLETALAVSEHGILLIRRKDESARDGRVCYSVEDSAANGGRFVRSVARVLRQLCSCRTGEQYPSENEGRDDFARSRLETRIHEETVPVGVGAHSSSLANYYTTNGISSKG
jgi:hypothetical protein